MTPEIVGTLILTCGGMLLALAAVLVTRNATRWPEIAARLAQVEVAQEGIARTATEAHEIATKARRVASTRAARTTKAAPEPEIIPHAIKAPPNGAWSPGVTQSGAPYTGVPDGMQLPDGGGGPHPVGFDD